MTLLDQPFNSRKGFQLFLQVHHEIKQAEKTSLSYTNPPPLFSFSFCCLHSSYTLLRVSLLALSTLSCVHCFLLPSKYIFILSFAPLKNFCHYATQHHFFSLSTVSAIIIFKYLPSSLLGAKLSTIWQAIWHVSVRSMQEITSKAVILLINSFAVIVKMEVGSFMILDDFSYVIFEVPGWHFLRGSMHFLSACS